MRRITIVLVALLLAAIGVSAAGCGGGEETTATPETVEGTVPADTGTAETGAETDTGGTDTGEGTETGDGGDGGGEGDAAAGEEVFASAGCGGCHTLQAAGSTGTVGPNLDEVQPDHDTVVQFVTEGSGPMPAFEDQLTEQQINDVAAYVSENAGS